MTYADLQNFIDCSKQSAMMLNELNMMLSILSFQTNVTRSKKRECKKLFDTIMINYIQIENMRQHILANTQSNDYHYDRCLLFLQSDVYKTINTKYYGDLLELNKSIELI